MLGLCSPAPRRGAGLMTDNHLTVLERALAAALDAGDHNAHRRLVDATLLGLIREKHEDRTTATLIAAKNAARAKAVDARLATIEAAQLTPEQREAVVSVVALGARALELADRIGAVMDWLRRAAMWLTPVLAFVAALAATRAVLAGWGDDIANWWRR